MFTKKKKAPFKKGAPAKGGFPFAKKGAVKGKPPFKKKGQDDFYK